MCVQTLYSLQAYLYNYCPCRTYSSLLMVLDFWCLYFWYRRRFEYRSIHVIGAHDYDHGRLEQNVYIYYLSRDYKLIIIVWIRSTDDCDKMRSAGGHELALRTSTRPVSYTHLTLPTKRIV